MGPEATLAIARETRPGERHGFDVDLDRSIPSAVGVRYVQSMRVQRRSDRRRFVDCGAVVMKSNR
jgi:hypothetical protein